MDTTILVAALACLLAIYFMRWLSLGGKLPPGPLGLPILGYIPFLSRKPYFDLQRLAKKYGNVFSLRLGSAYVVVLNDFESIKEAFAQDAFMGRPEESPFTLNKETLDTEAFNGLPWKEQRRFSLHMLRDLGFGKSKMEGHIQEEINELCEHIKQKGENPFCICGILAPSMSNNISSLVFGKRLKYDDPTRQMMTRVLNNSAAAAGQATWQLFFPWIKKICQFLGVGDVDKVFRIQEELRNYVWKEINEHEKTLDPRNLRDYIDGYLLEIQQRTDDPSFCKPVLQDLVGAFFGAGSETVRLSVEWLLLTASVYQDAQKRVQREIDDTVGRTQPLIWNDRKSMPFTQAFIMELMRWRTIIPLNVLRYAIFDGKINGYRIPKGSQLMANLWAIHHDPEYWGKDADEFKPERFLTDNGQEIKKWERYIPFSIGKRACPGEPLARIEVFLYFTSVLQKFDVKFPDGKAADFEGQLGIGLIPKPQELIFTTRS